MPRSRQGSRVGGSLPIVLAAIVAAVSVLTPQSADAQWSVETADGSSSIKLGFLVQGRAETFENADGESSKDDLYIRRLRLLAGGKITDKVTLFFETDSPNLGWGLPDGSKNRPDIYIQDFVITYHAGDAFKLDGGLILIPTCYNCNQSAASLLPVDYGAFSFLSSGPTTANVGRDYGLQARGYLADKHVEYRLGVFQGARGQDGSNGFRYCGRLMWHVLEPQTGLFYTGTSLGTQRLLAFGASFDTQEDYTTYAFDVFFDYPVFDGDGITLQADWVRWNGDVFFPSFPEQESLLFEAAYHVGAAKLSPFVQYLVRDYVDDDRDADETRWQAGLAWFPKGHNLTLKLGVGQEETDGSSNRFRGILQAQVFVF